MKVAGPLPEWHILCIARQEARRAWIEALRDRGVRAAHPDDGWVDRNRNTVKFVYPDLYPQFSELRVGDVVALGNAERYRLVRLTARCHCPIAGEAWSFESAAQNPL